MYKIIGMCIKTSYFVTWVVDYLVISEEPVPPEWKEKMVSKFHAKYTYVGTKKKKILKLTSRDKLYELQEAMI